LIAFDRFNLFKFTAMSDRSTLDILKRLRARRKQRVAEEAAATGGGRGGRRGGGGGDDGGVSGGNRGLARLEGVSSAKGDTALFYPRLTPEDAAAAARKIQQALEPFEEAEGGKESFSQTSDSTDDAGPVHKPFRKAVQDQKGEEEDLFASFATVTSKFPSKGGRIERDEERSKRITQALGSLVREFFFQLKKRFHCESARVL